MEEKLLTSIRKSDNKKVIALMTKKEESPFFCPSCFSETVLKKGLIKIAHFAHKPPVFCEFGGGESEYHMRCKLDIYNELCGVDGLLCELEKNLGKVIPDIYIESLKTGKRYAIEVQISTLTTEKIISRTKEYARLGIYVLWLPVFDSRLLEEKYSPAAWEKWLHGLYFGRVYYWKERLTVVPVHFSEYQLHVAESEWRKYGETHSAGGYKKRSKRYRTPLPGHELIIGKSFKATDRPAWNAKDMSFPVCKILTDAQEKWW